MKWIKSAIRGSHLRQGGIEVTNYIKLYNVKYGLYSSIVGLYPIKSTPSRHTRSSFMYSRQFACVGTLDNAKNIEVRERKAL